MNKRRYQDLRNFIDESMYSHKDVANIIGMNPARFSLKINKNKSNFTIDEASAICDVLDISMDDYFLNHNASKMKREPQTT
ncbi:helix-turn-helix transcriptional regulator [Staphylococcus epidermidis]|uniref:helix-turn-helix domain-containing protein n=1 Tax=Staphylococcus epidermidis TaxID=1282 RepID=UPI0021A554D1|nr:helix-turn-helix domain-containing protein [Staphylococcus epidermidis]MCG1168386.1 helix-turn-helix transcriptional regulator [Staphylococcus epidermidis]MCG1298531.1 helix-turn-helix transcriptional regulator [Staphylococcus epidermidis]MCG1433397.1 helix-turn-helix transcriptional regulator [Staphylococcus epidermidis]MCG1590979.1 helix-turn-helix transcriptional regulator [Staphylococcus epidermidis]MCG1670096.1 helix-turn-helix transcriptional regulator [Staphylococcus epidermidis]